MFLRHFITAAMKFLRKNNGKKKAKTGVRATKLRNAKDYWQQLEVRRGKENFPYSLRGSMALLSSWLLNSSLQYFERNFCCFKSWIVVICYGSPRKLTQLTLSLSVPSLWLWKGLFFLFVVWADTLFFNPRWVFTSSNYNIINTLC